MRFTALVVAMVFAACGTAKPGGMSGPTINNHVEAPAAPAVSPVVSSDILAREPVANRVQVKHILIGWGDLADNYSGHIDARAAGRSKHDAETAVAALVNRLKGGTDFDELMREYSEDTGSAESGAPIAVSPDAGLVIEFKQLGLRLAVGELGVCESQYGFHIMKRVE
jgi:PPIC-type PPIASE domain